MPWLRHTFASFAVPHYRMLWTGSMVATTAFMMSFILIPAVAYDITGTNTAAGIAQMGSGIGMLLVCPFGGVIADRLRKKPLVLAGQAVPGAMILAIGILIVSGAISILWLVVVTLVMGLGWAFMGPARQAWVGELMPPRLLPNSVALLQVGLGISQVLGPLFVAVLVGSAVGVGGTYLFMASLFAIILPITLSLPNTTPAPKAVQRSISGELIEGLRYVWGDPRLRLLWVSFVVIIVCGFSFQTLLPGLLDREFGRDPTDVGPTFLAFAVAGLLMNVVLAGVVHRPMAWPLMFTMGLMMMGGFALLATVGAYWLIFLAAIPLGAGRSGYWLVNSALLMTTADQRFYGRVMALSMMAFGVQAVMGPVWGAMADAIGVRETLLIVGAVGAAAIGLAILEWLRIRRRPRPAPLDAPLEPPGQPGRAR